MQLTVTADLLNKRKSIPSDLSDVTGIIGTVNRGYTFEGEEEINVPNPSIGRWYKDRDGNFYWGGGLFATSLVTDGGLIKFDPLKMSWGHQRYDLPFLWEDLNTMGEDATVAVIDTGVDVNHTDLRPNIDFNASLSYTGTDNSIADSDGHGTNMAGIIAAAGPKVFGVAPNARLIILKAAIDLDSDPRVFAKAVDHAATLLSVDVISISHSFRKNDPLLEAAIGKCVAAGKIVVAAIGNLRDSRVPKGPDKDTYPACYENVVAVGAFDKVGRICKYSSWNSKLSLVAPGDESVLTTGLQDTTAPGSGTSIATAFTAGCIALMISYAKRHGIPIAKCIPSLRQSCDDIGASVGNDIQTGYGRLNMRNAIAKLKL